MERNNTRHSALRDTAELISALVLAAAAMPAAQAQALQGNLERRPIEVVVQGGATSVPEDVANTHNREVGLNWRLTTPGYRFAGTGIVFEVKGKHSCKVSGDGRSARCAKIDHVPGQRFKYLVYVMRDSGQALAPLDPYIVND
jgi:hypothetical protein